MRNLSLLTVSACETGACSTTGATASRLCLDTVDERVYVVACEDDVLTVYAVSSAAEMATAKRTGQLVTEFPVEGPPAAPETTHVVVSAHFLAESNALCVILSNGDIHLLHKRDDAGEPFDVEVVGCIETGINAVAWSPDEELVTIVTGVDMLLLMTSSFEVLSEEPLHTSDEGAAAAVNVGWGRKETQFHGSAGKQAAQAKPVGRVNLAADDDKAAYLSWRGDGKFFACSAVDPNRDCRVVRFFSREAVLQNTGEPVDALGSCLCWRPSGNWIVTAQRQPHRRVILLFERNGLLRGEFTLHDPEATVKRVQWNADSTILAVWLTKPGQPDAVQLWTTSNYKWSLKQTIYAAEQNVTLVDLHWDVEQPLILHLLTSDGQYHRYRYAWDISTSGARQASNAALLAMIDGPELLVTPFRYANVPPPLSAQQVNVGRSIDCVAFSDPRDGNDVAIVCRGMVTFYNFASNARATPRLLGTISLPDVCIPRHLCWIKERNELFLVEYDAQTGKDSLVRLAIRHKDDTMLLDDIARVQLPQHALRLHYDSDLDFVLLEDDLGSVYNTAEVMKDPQQAPILAKLPEPCPWISLSGVLYVDGSENRLPGLPVALSESGKLYVDGTLVSAECTSFFVHSGFILFTTFKHVLRLIPTTGSAEDILALAKQGGQEVEQARRVERGARIITAVQRGVSVVLQMPRGNLETISPRIMVLHSVADDLDRFDFRSAFLACRRHRVDTNVIHRYFSGTFVKHIPQFLEQLCEIDYINLFISNLQEHSADSITRTSGHNEAEAQNASGNIVNDICAAIIDELAGKDERRYTQPILIAHIRKQPTDIVGALAFVRHLREQGIGHAALSDAIKFICVMVDVNRLYKEALGMYDFDLVLMVVQNSHLDPREHIPFLNELKALEPWYRRFRIDDSLGRHLHAMKSLLQAGDKYTEELVQYIGKHQLFAEACDLMSGDTAKLQMVHAVHADFLLSQDDYKRAAHAYVLAGKNDDAVEAFLQAGLWREMFALAPQECARLVELARRVCVVLEDKRSYVDAATITIDYLKDTETAVDLLLRGSKWIEAGRTARLHSRDDLVETAVLESLSEGVSRFDEDMELLLAQLDKQFPRLLEVRKEKARAQAYMGPEVDQHLLDDVEIQSASTAMTSQFSRFTPVTLGTTRTGRTHKSSRSKRREERKKLRGKKGSVYEEHYLVDSLRKLQSRVVAMKDEVEYLASSLIIYQQPAAAKRVSTAFSSLLERVADAELNAAIVDDVILPVGHSSVAQYMMSTR
ncbi:IKI3 family-domain-containing protein [Thamnocephalis sphaerospora]|uniref:Elongator complex protein 1 n=1 Tax=Thamnocephalis sphaerospora TaxID=78915 RepID=A0A4V1IXB3_9FUNG|nr:IKI3 family-domain-containing protein [Thamnocephalis sphaerospora]|eukprot:RKP10459.1 IKI3 family-domain-containing protein [Thamnocephalis sphaerospora]